MIEDRRAGPVALVFLRLGALGFGGPQAHIALMEDELVRRRGWLDRAAFGRALGLTNLIPGPNSSELAIHVGYLRAGVRGGLAAGLAFMAPGLVAMIALSAIYFELAGGEIARGAFGGMQPVVVAVLAVALWRLRAHASAPLRGVLAAGALAAGLLLPGWEPVVLLAAGLVAAAPRMAASGTLLTAAPLIGILAAAPALVWVFIRTGALLFGGGYVLLPLLEPEVVSRGWLTRPQFLDGVAMGQVTPGPIVLTAAFVGYRVGGVGGALLATAAIYLPSFLAVFLVSGPLFRRAEGSPALAAFADGAAAAALGAIAAAGIRLGDAALASAFDWSVLAVAAVALAARAPIAAVVVAGAAVGLVRAAI